MRLHERGSFPAERGSLLRLTGLARRGYLGLEAALLEEEVVELHRLNGGALMSCIRRSRLVSYRE